MPEEVSGSAGQNVDSDTVNVAAPVPTMTLLHRSEVTKILECVRKVAMNFHGWGQSLPSVLQGNPAAMNGQVVAGTGHAVDVPSPLLHKSAQNKTVGIVQQTKMLRKPY